MNKLAVILVAVSSAVAQEQSGRLQFDWSKLAAKASEKVDVNLEGPMLEMASKFLSGDKKNEAEIKKLVMGLRGVYVKTFEFEKEGEYSEADVKAIRSQLRAPEWSNIVDVQEKRESVAVYLKTDGKQTLGIVVVAAEPKEFTFVQILGPIDPSMLGTLGGSFGIPNMNFGPKPSTTPAPARKKED